MHLGWCGMFPSKLSDINFRLFVCFCSDQDVKNFTFSRVRSTGFYIYWPCDLFVITLAGHIYRNVLNIFENNYMFILSSLSFEGRLSYRIIEDATGSLRKPSDRLPTRKLKLTALKINLLFYFWSFLTSVRNQFSAWRTGCNITIFHFEDYNFRNIDCSELLRMTSNVCCGFSQFDSLFRIGCFHDFTISLHAHER